MNRVRHCCDDLVRHMRACATCVANGKEEACPDRFIAYSDWLDEYSVLDKARGHGQWKIKFCPWCGTKFRESKAGRWADELDAMGIANPYGEDRDRVPPAYWTAEWWLSKES